MSTKVQDYLERAEHCERMAALAMEYETRAHFAELARQWRALARQHRDLKKSSATIKVAHHLSLLSCRAIPSQRTGRRRFCGKETTLFAVTT